MKAIISRPGDGERYVRDNRVVTIKVDLPELSIDEVEFDTTFDVSLHTHDHVDTLYVVDGEIEFLDGDDVIHAGPGNASSLLRFRREYCRPSERSPPWRGARRSNGWLLLSRGWFPRRG
jgi:hypothetical protein